MEECLLKKVDDCDLVEEEVKLAPCPGHGPGHPPGVVVVGQAAEIVLPAVGGGHGGQGGGGGHGGQGGGQRQQDEQGGLWVTILYFTSFRIS